MRKYFYSIFLFFFLLSPSWLLAKESSTVTNSLAFGGEYNDSVFFPLHSWGGYFGVETHLGNPFVSLLNTFGVGDMGIEDLSSFHFHILDIYYTLGLRAYLGTPYVFLDFNIGAVGYFSIPYQAGNYDIYWLASALLGFNIPLSDHMNFQIAGGIEYPTLGILNYKIRAGLQFKL